jgi:hypothetical protein
MRGRFQALNGWSIDQLRAIIECDSLSLISPLLHGPERASCQVTTLALGGLWGGAGQRVFS